jgi:ABC-type phosphate transport system permease subunit
LLLIGLLIAILIAMSIAMSIAIFITKIEQRKLSQTMRFARRTRRLRLRPQD